MLTDQDKEEEKRLVPLKRVLSFSTWEFMNNMYQALSVDEEDRIIYRPLRLYIEGTHVEALFQDLSKDLNKFNYLEEPTVERVTDSADADIRISVRSDKEYEFVGHDGYFEIFEHLKFDRFEVSDEAETRLMAYLREEEDILAEESPDYARRTIPDRARELLYDEDNVSGYCLEMFEGPSLVVVVRDVFARYLKDRGKLNAPRTSLNFEKERFLTMFYQNRTPDLKVKDWLAVFTGLDEMARPREEGHDPQPSEPKTISEGWLGLRELAESLFREKGLSERDITICSHWLVPEEAGITNVDLRKSLTENLLIPRDIRQAGFNDVIRRKVSRRTSEITPSDLGRLGEEFAQRIVSPGALECYTGPEPFGVCDLSDVPSGDPARATWAVNIKLSLEDEVNRSFEVAPEHLVPTSWVLLIMPRHLLMRLYPISGETMTINSASGGLCVGPEELGERLKEMISK